MIKNYINENKEKAFQVSGIYEDFNDDIILNIKEIKTSIV